MTDIASQPANTAANHQGELATSSQVEYHGWGGWCCQSQTNNCRGGASHSSRTTKATHNNMGATSGSEERQALRMASFHRVTGGWSSQPATIK